ncbi:hypothetical protein CP965_12830 [Halarcobacter mediterraneus]|uniref:Chemotaxis protein n=1 Tax=Halarcobacter mediterraneus TaxID=2023153 RepID=A0A4Q1AV14_9BACT|nr:methyl-accepting chemotaxis protein [Halarcobacter mediterraneus]RXK11650.1 hypothetical protein CP965_12830 [Halarcobacter mediterraneus]
MLDNFSILFKLKINSFLIILGLCISALITYNTLNSLSKEYSYSLDIAKQSETLNAIYINGLLYNSSSGVVFQNPSSAKAKNTMTTAINAVQKAAKEFEGLDKNLYSKFEPKVTNFLNIVKPLYKKVEDGNLLEKKDMSSSLQAWRDLKFTITDILKIIQANSQVAQKNFHTMIEDSIITIVILMLVIILVILAFNVLLSRSIISPLESLEKAMANLTNSSDINKKIEIKTKDETAKIAKNFNEYINKIEKAQSEDTLVIKDVQNVVNEIKSGKLNTRVKTKTSNSSIMELVTALNSMLDTLHNIIDHALNTLDKYQHEDFKMKTSINSQGEIAALLKGIDSLGDAISKMLVQSTKRGLELRTSSATLLKNVDTLNISSSEAASNLEETAAALEQITSNVTSSTQKMNKMSQVANKVTSATKEGQDLAHKTGASMDEIDEQVNLINDAITIIDQIAFQTNILSLNAAVEAATAGEAGKGFTVVAGEVRNLATKSAEAAKEIKELVEHATVKAKEGKDISDSMIKGYSSLNENIDQTLKIIKEVSISSNEQQKGIVQINDAISGLDQKTQENAHIASQVQEIAFSTEKLAEQIVEGNSTKEFLGKDELNF